MRVFGCKCYVHNNGKQSLGKFDPRSDEAIFIGYSPRSKAYKVFNKRTLLVEESIHVIFDEVNTFGENVKDYDEDFQIGLYKRSEEQILNSDVPTKDENKTETPAEPVQEPGSQEVGSNPGSIPSEEPSTETLDEGKDSDGTSDNTTSATNSNQGDGGNTNSMGNRAWKYQRSHPTELIISDANKKSSN